MDPLEEVKDPGADMVMKMIVREGLCKHKEFRIAVMIFQGLLRFRGKLEITRDSRGLHTLGKYYSQDVLAQLKKDDGDGKGSR